MLLDFSAKNQDFTERKEGSAIFSPIKDSFVGLFSIKFEKEPCLFTFCCSSEIVDGLVTRILPFNITRATCSLKPSLETGPVNLNSLAYYLKKEEDLLSE